MKILSTLLLLSSLFIQAKSQSNITKSFMFDGLTRDYIIHLPTGYSTATKYPIVFNLHGYTSNAIQEQFYSKMDIVSNTDPERFIIVYPNGVANAWNSWTASGVDDVGFISELIDSMNAQYNVDLNRVYSCGMSNGGFQSYRLACELSNRIVAIASVTGSMSSYVYSNCNPSRPVPVLEIHGTADATVPYAGQAGMESIDQVIQFWQEHNACGISDTTAVANISTTDNCTVDEIKFNDCDNGSKTWLFKVWDGGHSWPDAAIDLMGLNTNRDINASQEIWDFFKQFTMFSSVNVPILESNKTSISLAPNPSNDILNISLAHPFQRIVLSDMMGNIKLVTPIDNTLDFTLSLKSLSNGMYHLQFLNSDNTSESRRVIVIH